MPGAAPFWKLSTLDPQRRVLTGAAGAALIGHRLAPGAQVPDDLLHQLKADDPEAGQAAVAALCHVPAPVEELLAEARQYPAVGVTGLARRLGVSPRSLQRMARHLTGQPPLFWLRLIRLRQALSLARQGIPLVEAAVDAGFADQAHFTREAQQFHAATPGRLLADARAMDAILAPGL